MTAAHAERTAWRIAGEEVNSCNCDWGCPCQFMAPPTHGACEVFIAYQINRGHFGGTPLDGVRFARAFRYPGPVHLGNGTRLLIIDEAATPQQRDALVALDSGAHGNPNFEIFAAVAPTVLEPVVAPIALEVDRKARRAAVSIPGVAESRLEPIRNPVTGEAHDARIVLPRGFEFTEAEMADTVAWRVTAGPLQLAHEHAYGQLNAFDWSGG